MKICKVKNCGKIHYGLGYCRNHYEQFRRHGKILKRTMRDKNEIIIKKNHAEIVLYNRGCKEIGRTLIDIKDVAKVKKYKWCIGSKGYAINRNQKLLLHKLILPSLNNEEIDHINHITLDNRKSNLRKCTRSENQMNRKICGYSYHKHIKLWYVRISVNRRTYHIGYFKKESEAKKARKLAEKKFFKEFAYNNKQLCN